MSEDDLKAAESVLAGLGRTCNHCGSCGPFETPETRWPGSASKAASEQGVTLYTCRSCGYAWREFDDGVLAVWWQGRYVSVDTWKTEFDLAMKRAREMRHIASMVTIQR